MSFGALHGAAAGRSESADLSRWAAASHPPAPERPGEMARDLRDVLDAILAGVVVIDSEGTVDQLNSAACRILEHSADAAKGIPVERLLGPTHALARLGRKVLETGISTSENSQEIESRFTEDLRVDVAASPLFDEIGDLAGLGILGAQRQKLPRTPNPSRSNRSWTTVTMAGSSSTTRMYPICGFYLPARCADLCLEGGSSGQAVPNATSNYSQRGWSVKNAATELDVPTYSLKIRV